MSAARQPRRALEPYTFETGSLGVASDWKTIRVGGNTGTGYRPLLSVGGSGELELELRVSTATVIGAWTVEAGKAPQPVYVPSGATLRARRPAATAGLSGSVLLFVLEGAIPTHQES